MKHHLKKVFDPAYNGKYYYSCEVCTINAWNSVKQLIAVHKFKGHLVESFNANYKNAQLVSYKISVGYNGARIQKDGNIYVMNIESGDVLCKIDCLFTKKELLVKSIIE